MFIVHVKSRGVMVMQALICLKDAADNMDKCIIFVDTFLLYV